MFYSFERMIWRTLSPHMNAMGLKEQGVQRFLRGPADLLGTFDNMLHALQVSELILTLQHSNGDALETIAAAIGHLLPLCSMLSKSERKIWFRTERVAGRRPNVLQMRNVVCSHTTHSGPMQHLLQFSTLLSSYFVVLILE